MSEPGVIESSSRGRMSLSVWFLCLTFLLLFGFSHFGALNPHYLGQLSGMTITLVAIAAGMFVGRYGRVPFALYIAGTWLLFAILIVANWWHYQYFQSYFNYESLRFGGDALNVNKALSAFEYKQEALLFSGVTLVTALGAIFSYRKSAFLSRSARISMPVVLVIALAGYVIAAHSFERYRELNMFKLSPAGLHPVQAFFTNGGSGVVEAAEADSVWGYFREMNTVAGPDVQKEADVVQSQQGEQKYNVLVIVLEAFRASMLGHYGSPDSMTPVFDDLANKYITARNFYANANYTVKGETSIWCGIFDHNTKPPISIYFKDVKNLDCLPQIFADRGYETLYVHGFKGKFNDRRDFLPMLGYSDIFFYADEHRGRVKENRIGWGVADTLMYDLLLEKLERLDGKPFFTNFMTLSSHYPFAWEWNGVEMPFESVEITRSDADIFTNYKNAIYYQDYALGQFWEKFEQSPLYDNTIVVITADHGIWAFGDDPDMDIYRRNEHYFRMPLLIYHPEIQEKREISAISSQVDLPPTILSLAGIEGYDDLFVGKNIFEEVANPWAIMMKNGEVIFRNEERICYSSSTECSGVQQSCVPSSMSEIYFFSEDEERSCFEVEGDLLTTTAKLKKVESNGEISRSFDLINLHNQRIFQ